jgi:hypothetical protein
MHVIPLHGAEELLGADSENTSSILSLGAWALHHMQ